MDEQSAPPAGAGATDAGQGSAPAPAPAPSDAPPTLLHALLSQPPSNARALFFSNLLLLGFDPARPVASSVAPFLSAAELAAKTDAAEEKDPLDADMFAKGGLTGSGKAFECTARFLFGIIDASQAKERFGASLYTLNRVDSKQFRNVAFEWISALKKQNMLKGDEIVVRRSALDECRGERFEKMMLSLSELALRIDLERLSESNEDALPVFPDFQPIKRSLGPACFSLFTAGMNLQTQLVSDDFARKTRERHRQQVAWADLGAELGRRWETVIRDIEQIKSERAVLLEGRPENLPRVAAEMRAELESLWTPFATWLERAQHEHFPWIAPLLSDDVKPVSLSAFPSDAMDPNVHIIPSLQVPQQFSTPDWIPALRKAGINPLLPANLGYDLEGLAGLWKLTLAMMLGALGGEVDSKLVHPDLRAVLMRSGVPVADAVDDLHAGGSGETVGRLGSIMGTVVADFIAGKLESLRTIADEAKRASDELESTVTDVALTVPQIKRTSVAPMEVEPSFSPVGLPSASSAAHPLETRKLSLPIPFIATKEPSPSPSMQKSAMDSLDLDSLQTPFARPASRSSRASLDPPAPPFSIDPVASVADDPLDFLLPSVAMPSLRLGGARAILSSVDSIGGAFEFPPTPPRISPHGTAEKEKAKTKPIVAKKATAPASLGYGKGRSPAKTLMKRLASSTSSSLVSSPAGTSVSRSPRRSSTVSSSRAKPTPVPNSADTAAPRTSKPKLAGFDKLCEQIAASAPVPKVPTTAGPTPVSTSRSTSIASRPTTVRVPTSAASRPKKPQPSVTDDPDYAAFSTRAEIPRTPVSAKPASRAPAPSSPNPPSQAQALSVSFAPDVVTPKKDNSGLSSAIKKMATPGSAKNPSGLRNRLWPPASAGSSPAKSEGRDPDKDPPMIFEELAPFDLADGDGSPAPSPAVENRARNTIGKGSPLRTSTKPISKHGSPAKVKTPVRRPETKKTSQGSAVAKTPGGGTFKVEKLFKLDSPFLTPQPSRDVRLSDVSSSNYSQQSSPSANRSLRF